uniref:Leucine-rich repeats and IQ motif containing 1 n=1 Tax=Nannospalax galili TaxID=1026970 RepID=A0A8C6QDI3_NANGA
MEDNDDDGDTKLKEEVEAELDKISISSLGKDEVESDSETETHSDDSSTGSVELPESVLHCINVIKNKSKTAEELILQDLEDTGIFIIYKKICCSSGTASSNHMHLRIGSSRELKGNSEQLMRILSGIEKEEFIRSQIHSAMSISVSEIDPVDESMDECVLPDDADMKFGYFEVEERCRKSFEAWQDKQKELEDQDKECLKAQRDIENKQFEEEEEKRHCWIKQFEAEKKKLENIQKQDQDKMNDELHKEEKMWKEKFRQHEEFIRNLHLQIDEEQTRFNELREKEKARSLELRHNAVVKIQAKYKAFVTYRKYAPIIKEQIERKKRKAQEWEEIDLKIRQKEEERRRKFEEEQRIEEIKKQMQEEKKRRETEYEEQKNTLRQRREDLRNKEKARLEDSRQLTMNCALGWEEYRGKPLTVTDASKSKSVAKELVSPHSQKRDGWLVPQANKRENVYRQPALKESTEVKLKPNQAIFVDSKMKEKSEDLSKTQCFEKLVKPELKYEDIDKKTELENSDLKENENVQCQGQELKPQTQKEESMAHTTRETVGQETHVISGHDRRSEVNNRDAQKTIKDDQEGLMGKVENKEILEENNTSVIPAKEILSPSLKNPEAVEENVILEDKVIDRKSEGMEEVPKDYALPCDTVIVDTGTLGHTEGKTNQQDYVLGNLAPSGDVDNYNAKHLLISEKESSLKSEMKEILEQWQESRAECDSVMPCPVPQVTFLSSIKERRQAWIKSFKPWFEIFKQNQHKNVIKRKRFVKCLASKMPPLDSSEILRHGPWDTLQQVTTITLQDLTSCCLSTLAECPNLQLLSLQRCGLRSLHGLNNCKNLKYIDAQENHIETINCENLESLCVVLLNKNQLTSIHGLDGCINIQNLELSHNKITRISGLESLKYLQQLTVDHNQLISTKGLSEAPTIIYLDCSHNHLTDVEDIGNCGLLQIVKLQGNYLREPPSLKNHVLLRKLHLDDNSISTVEELSSCWLPLLQDLTISQNSLTKFVPLFHFVSLEKLDVSNNCFSDLESAIHWFRDCNSLRELCITGNPILQERNWRNSLLKVLPALRILNGDVLNSSSDIHIEQHYEDLHCFLALCQSQIQEFTSLTEKFTTQEGNVFTLHAVDNLCLYYRNLMRLSNECRRQGRFIFFMRFYVFVAHYIAYEDFSTSVYSCILIVSFLLIFSMAAVLIQAHWRGYTVLRQINVSPKMHPTLTEPLHNTYINNQTTSSKERRENVMTVQEQREKAALLIQAVWKGFILRKKLATALEAIRNEESGEEYEEIDLEDFTFDEDALEKDWLALDSTRFPSQTLPLSNQLAWPKNSRILKYDEAPLDIAAHPTQAWQCNEKENLLSSEHTPLSTRSEKRTLFWTPQSKTSIKNFRKSEKEEKISEEWGFKDISTAQQMLKRAQKMKSKKLREKMDPSVRLALFKHNKNKVSVTKSTKKTQLRSDSCFEGKRKPHISKEEDFICKDTTAKEKLERSKEYTYQWLHTQVGIHETTSSRIMKCSHFLPELNPDVLNGGRVQLVARLVSREDTDLDLSSMTSGSALSVNREKKSQAHRHSAGSSSKLWFPSELI